MNMKIAKSTIFLLILILFVGLGQFALAEQEHKEVDVINMTTPFGTAMYNAGVAFEKVFEKADTWINWKVQETPGAMYMVRYWHENYKKMAAGEVPYIIGPASTGILPFIIEGRRPFQKYEVPTDRAIFSTPAYIVLMSTFNQNLKTAMDLKGKRVGLAEKARPFQSVMPMKPYFGKGLGIWEEVNWQFLGNINSKDALLNNKIDARYTTFRGKVKKRPDGTFVCEEMAPNTPTLELLNSGRKLHFIPFDPEVVKRAYDFSTDMMVYPILVKKGACEGIDHDIWARVTFGTYCTDASMPDDWVQEIIRIRHKYREKLGDYHATLKYFPENPYPMGVPEKWVHPGVKKAMKNLGIPMPGEE